MRTDASPLATEPRCIGRGRSGVVFLLESEKGPKIARKIFDSGTLTRLVQYIFLGAANPYAWSEHAIRGALLRRRILAELVPMALKGRMHVARALGHGWDEDRAAMTLDTEYIDGAHPALHHPLSQSGKQDTDELRHKLLPQLQEFLRETGFDGMLWQAGLGNPVAFANFILRKDARGTTHWFWVDLESGVPALFPARLGILMGTYLPLCFKYRAPLFDHTDTTRLTAWLTRNGARLDAARGAGTTKRLLSDCAALEVSGMGFWQQTRLQKSIASQETKGRVSHTEARLYARRPLRWWSLEALRGMRGTITRTWRLCRKFAAQLQQVPWLVLPAQASSFMFSQQRREQVARAAILLRVDQWTSRGSLSPAHAIEISAAVHEEDSSAWLSDFAVHLGIKPLVKATEWIVFPALLLSGTVSEATVALVILAGGSLSRSLYTSLRTIQEISRGGKPPWIALGVGVLPVLGNLAYPAQIAWTGHGDKNLPAQFLLYDGLTLIGRRLPIWGGRNTLTEQLSNHAVDRLVRRSTRTKV